jgi:hypothetical protein
MGEHSPLDRLVVPLVGDHLRSAPYRLLGWSFVDECWGVRQMLQVDA